MIKPTQDYLLVERIEKEDENDQAIILPNKQGPKQYDVLEGIIKAVGPGRRSPTGERIEIPIDTGDNVLYRQYAGHHIVKDDKDYWLINERDIVGILEEN